MLDLNAIIAGELIKSLFPDFRAWAPSLGKSLIRKVQDISMREFSSLDELLNTLQQQATLDGSRIRLKTKPSPFGPFLKNHFLPLMIGNNTSLRLGPTLVGGHPLFDVMMNTTSHLTPVGLYPVVDAETIQGCLYPANSQVCGMIGLFPGVSNVVPHLQALLTNRHSACFGVPSWITGVVRRIDASALNSAGLTIEDYEIIRQSGDVWFFDATGDDSNCTPVEDGDNSELWGGLYASGHIEIQTGSLEVSSVAEILGGSISAEGIDVQITQNQAGAKEVFCFAQGIRAILDSNYPWFSFHMDAELSHNFSLNRTKFDRITSRFLQDLQGLCNDKSVELLNPCDLDFTYTDGTEAYSVLKSPAAEAIVDPLAISIRDWHQQRSAVSRQPK